MAKSSQVFANMNVDEIINVRSSNDFYKKYQKEITNNNRAVSQTDNFYPKELSPFPKESDYQEIFQKDAGWIAEIKGKNFIKKNTGTGRCLYLNFLK